MNLVSYEFVACQDAKKGVLILSEVITKIYNFICLLMLDYFDPGNLSLLLDGRFLNVENITTG